MTRPRFKRETLSGIVAGALIAAAQGHADPILAQTMRDAEPATSGGAALEMLRSVGQTVSRPGRQRRQDEAYLTTGSIVQSGGSERVLYHLPMIDEDLRLAGETAVRTWPVFIGHQQLQGAVNLRLAYKNAVSVMPEASRLSVEINGVKIGSQPIQSPARPKTLVFKVPTHTLVPGFNEVRVLARQRHRVDCSVRATHELWTDIEPSRTGLVFSTGNGALRSLDSLSAVARNKAGRVKMRLLIADIDDSMKVQEAMELAQRASIYGHFRNPQVEVAHSSGTGAGIDMFVGTLEELRIVAPGYAEAVRPGLPFQVIARDGDERVALIMLRTATATAAAQSGLDGVLKAAFTSPAMQGSVAGIRAAAGAPMIQTGENTPFSELGLQSEEFDGRLYKRSMRFKLPADYYPADYNHAEIRLVTGYSAGLERGNKFIVRVNGATVTGFALNRSDGYIFHNKMLRLPLSAFRPGLNVIELEARLAKAEDQTCDPVSQIESDKRFVISGASVIRFPRLAHLGRLPDLSGTVSAGFPYILGDKAQPTIVSVPSPAPEAVSAAAAFVTQIATRAGVPMDFSLTYDPPHPQAANAVVIGEYASLPAKIASRIKGIDTQKFQTAWTDASKGVVPSLAARDGIDRMTTAGISSPGEKTGEIRSLQLSLAIGRDSPVEHVIREPSKAEDLETNERTGFTNQIWQLATSVFGTDGNEDRKPPRITNPQADILLSQQLSQGPQKGAWTVITARDLRALADGVALLGRSAVAAQMSGGTAAVNGVDHTVTSAAAAHEYVQTRPFSLRNSQLIVAGWFSNNHAVYSALLLFGLVLMGLATNGILRVFGVRSDGKPAKEGSSDV